jgi:capsular exopolysaccharide synthesis family protein
MLGDSLNAVGSTRLERNLPKVANEGTPRAYVLGDNQFDDLAEGGLDLVRYLRVLQRHWLLLAACLILAIGAGIASLLLRDPIYTAAVTIQIDKESPSSQVVQNQGAAEVIASEEFFQTQYGLLRSRSLAERTINELGLSKDSVALAAFGIDPELAKAPTPDLDKAVLEAFQDNLDVAPVRGSRLVNINFDSRDPVVSARIANSIAEHFIASNIERRFEASSYNRTFLEQQLQKEKVKLEDAERQLAAYAKGQQLISIAPTDPKEGSSSANQSLTASSLLALNQALSEARGERIKAEARWRQAEAASGDSLAEVLQSPTIQNLKEVRAKLQADYQEKAKVQKPSMPEVQSLQARITENERLLTEEVTSIRNSLRAQYDITRAQERQFESQVAQLKGSVLDLRDRSINYDILQREVDTSRQLYEGLLQKYREIGVAGDLRSNNIFIIDRAEPPGGPSKPRPLFTLAIAVGIGLVAGVLAAFLREFLDESIRSPEDVERKLGVPLLGTIPKLEKGVDVQTALADIRSNFAEAYYSVRTALQFSTNEGVPSTLLITSARPAEGKSTSARAIAINFARLGQRVLLVDGDLRNPSLHRAFAEENTSGLTNFLTGGATIAELARKTHTPNLDFIPSGPLPPSPAELLASNRVRELMTESQQHYDMLIIDGPPVMGLADAPLLGSLVAGSLLVIEAGGTGRNLAKATIKRMGVGRAKILGVLLTKFDARKSSSGYGYGYSYAYGYEYGTRPALKGKA